MLTSACGVHKPKTYDFPMMSIYPPKQRGFSLLEVMIVLVITAMLMGVVATAITSGPTLRKSARDVVSSLRHARAIAVMQQMPIVWKMDINNNHFWIDGSSRKTRNLHQTVNAKIQTAQSEVISPTIAGVRFFPDGSSTGGKIELQYRQQQYVVNVEWISGRISLQ